MAVLNTGWNNKTKWSGPTMDQSTDVLRKGATYNFGNNNGGGNYQAGNDQKSIYNSIFNYYKYGNQLSDAASNFMRDGKINGQSAADYYNNAWKGKGANMQYNAKEALINSTANPMPQSPTNVQQLQQYMASNAPQIPQQQQQLEATPDYQIHQQAAQTLDNSNKVPVGNFNRSDIRNMFRTAGLNPYSFSGSQRRELRNYLNGKGQLSEGMQKEWGSIIGSLRAKQQGSVTGNSTTASNNDISNILQADKMAAMQNKQNTLQAGEPITHPTNNTVIAKKFGGTMYYKDGGALSQNQEKYLNTFKAFLVKKAKKAGAKSDQDVQTYIQNLGEDGLKKAKEEFDKLPTKALHGAKLSYINKLNGQCPEGTTLKYYKVGGKVCKVCEAKDKQYNDPIKAFKEKCGGKVKKADTGTNLDAPEEKKKSKPVIPKRINPNDTVNIGNQAYSLTDRNGRKLVPSLRAYGAKEYQADMKAANKGKKDAARRWMKQNMVTGD